VEFAKLVVGYVVCNCDLFSNRVIVRVIEVAVIESMNGAILIYRLFCHLQQAFQITAQRVLFEGVILVLLVGE